MDSKVELVHLSWNIIMDEIKRAGKVSLLKNSPMNLFLI